MSRNRSRKPTQGTLRAELIGFDRITCGDITVVCDYPVLKLCRVLVSHGFDPNIRLDCYRGAMLCMTVASIGQGAQLVVARDGVGFRIRPNCDAVTAPPMRKKSRLGLTQQATSGALRAPLTAEG
jgi:hypothetical protein